MVEYKTAPSTFLKGNTTGTMMQTRSMKISFYLMSHSLWSAADVFRFSLSLPDSPIWVQCFIFHLSFLPWGVASFHFCDKTVRSKTALSLYIPLRHASNEGWHEHTWPDWRSTTAQGQIYSSMRLRASGHLPGVTFFWRFVAFIITKQTLLDWSV